MICLLLLGVVQDTIWIAKLTMCLPNAHIHVPFYAFWSLWDVVCMTHEKKSHFFNAKENQKESSHTVLFTSILHLCLWNPTPSLGLAGWGFFLWPPDWFSWCHPLSYLRWEPSHLTLQTHAGLQTRNRSKGYMEMTRCLRGLAEHAEDLSLAPGISAGVHNPL